MGRATRMGLRLGIPRKVKSAGRDALRKCSG
jgi:hypothetical protein